MKKLKVVGGVGKRFASKDGSRTVVIMSREDDTKSTTRSGEPTTVAVWLAESEQTKRRTKIRDDSLVKDYIEAPAAKAPKKSKASAAKVPAASAPKAAKVPAAKSPKPPAVKAPKAPKASAAVEPPLPPPPQIQLINHVWFALDTSGSMQSIANDAVKAFNQMAGSVREQTYKTGQMTTVSLTTFGDGPGEVVERYSAQPITSLKDLSPFEYRPSGQTPLFDAVGTVATKMRSRYDANASNVSFLGVIITDGHENYSRRFEQVSLNLLMRELQNTDRWSFVFLVPPGHKKQLCNTFGIPDGNVREWETTSAGMRQAAADVSAGIQSYYAGRSAGSTSTKGFFQTDTSSISKSQARSSLDDMTHKVHVLDVNRTVQIRDFVNVELRGGYWIGCAYYQLMKDEKVQAGKAVMIRARDTGQVYGGPNARATLGLPPHLDVMVRPGDHGAWDIFIQSTSTNRRLNPGMKLIVVKQ